MQALVVKRSSQSVIGMGNPFTAISIYHSAPILEKKCNFWKSRNLYLHQRLNFFFKQSWFVHYFFTFGALCIRFNELLQILRFQFKYVKGNRKSIGTCNFWVKTFWFLKMSNDKNFQVLKISKVLAGMLLHR